MVTLLLLLLVGTSPETRVISRCNDATAWDGGTLDHTVLREGRATLRWAHADSTGLLMRQPPADWSTRSAIRLWLHNARPSRTSVMFILQSENEATEGMDYWMAELPLDFEGWHEVVLLRKRMGMAREPRGWDQIDHVFFTASGWGHTPDPAVVMHLGGIEMFDAEAVPGPRMTDEEFLTLLDLNRPELQAVKAALDDADIEQAKTALAAYFRHRTSVPWYFDPDKIDRDISHNRAAADATLAGKFSVIGIEHQFTDGKVDWFYNPTVEQEDLPVNYEWQWQLGRMGYWSNLGRTYWATGDERYARGFVDHVRSWTRQCPRPYDSGNYANSAWRTIECGIRMAGSWPDAYHRFLHSPSFTDQDLLLFVKSCIEQAEHLREYPTSGNWLTMEMAGLYTVGALFPEFQPAEEWRRYTIGRIYEELTEQFLPDGAQVELTPGYHQVALSNVLKIPSVAQVVGRMDELPPDFIAHTERAFDYNLRLMTPNRDMPRFNDSWHVNVPGSLAGALRLFPERADFRWIATDGREGHAPDFTSVPLPYAGYFMMRSGWERDTNALCFDAGPLGYGHVHQDKLNVVLWAYGREILLDGGGGNYEHSRWRRYDTDTFSHNTVLVDGKPQRRQTRDRWANVSRTPIDVAWESDDSHDYARGVYDGGYGVEDARIATHTREVFFLKPDRFLVVDTLAPQDGESHTYQARWHLLSTDTEQDPHTQGVCTADAEQPNLLVLPLATEGLSVEAISAQMEPELLGWWVQKSRPHEPATTVTHTRQGTGTQRFVTLLVPFKAGEDVPIREIIREGDAHWKIVQDDGRKFTVHAGHDSMDASRLVPGEGNRPPDEQPR